MSVLPEPLYYTGQIVSVGGLAKTVSAFRRTWGGEIVSFSVPRTLAAAGGGGLKVMSVRSRKN